jgi:hypothetical protein
MARAIKVGRNDPCSCGSGKKFKHCCATKPENPWRGRILMAVVLGLIVGGVFAGVTSLTTHSGTSGPTPGQVWSPEHGHYH